MVLENLAVKVIVQLLEESVQLRSYVPVLGFFPSVNYLSERLRLYYLAVFQYSDENKAVKKFLDNIIKGANAQIWIVLVDIFCELLALGSHLL